MKLSNKKRLTKLKKAVPDAENRPKLIIMKSPHDPFPENLGNGSILMVPDNGHRFPHQPAFENDE